MAYNIQSKLVIGIASSALFNLDESDAVLRKSGEEAYRKYQEGKLDTPLDVGVAHSFIRRLLSLNDLAEPNESLVEVIILSRNAPDTGLRVMRSIAHHNLSITRAIFTQGKSPFMFMSALNMSLFLSANADDVREAIKLDLPAGQVLGNTLADDDDGDDLRIAFDFDGVLADDESEKFIQNGTLQEFHAHESANKVTPHNPGPLKEFLLNMNKIQKLEEAKRAANPEYKIRVRMSIVTARNAPSHERAVASLKTWGVTVNDAFFLGGIAKAPVLTILRPHIFFDDQRIKLDLSSLTVPSVHVPFGMLNETKQDNIPSTSR
jgi:5'-nucleotidase